MAHWYPLMPQGSHIGRISGDFSRAFFSVFPSSRGVADAHIGKRQRATPHIPKRNIACLLRAFQKSKGGLSESRMPL
jgi:hypothetical protein